MDVVICLSAKDHHIVKTNIKCIRKYLQSDEEYIYIISNVKNKIFFSKKWLTRLHVIFIDEDRMVEGLSMQAVRSVMEKHFTCQKYPSWYLQQFLKMGFALSRYATMQYLIWDSDTIPLHQLSYYENGRYLFTVKEENHTPYFDTTERLLGFRRLAGFSFIAEHMPIDVDVMKELIHAIACSDVDGDLWFEKIINATSGKDQQAFSEFETYGNYCMAHHPVIFKSRCLRTLREAGLLFGRAVRKGDLKRLAMMNFDTASFEIRHKPRFPQIIFYWLDRIQLALMRRLKFVN